MPAANKPRRIFSIELFSRKKTVVIKIKDKDKYAISPLLRPRIPYTFCEVGDLLSKVETVANKMKNKTVISGYL